MALVPVHGKVTVFQLGTQGSEGTVADISSWLTDVQMPQSVDTPETTTFGAAAKTYATGVPGGTISLTGYWDAVIEAQMQNLIADNTAVTFKYGPAGSASGKVQLTGVAIIQSFQRTSPVADKVGWTATLQISGAVTRTTWP